MREVIRNIFFLAAVASIALSGHAQRNQSSPEAQLQKFNQFYLYLNGLYVDSLDNGALMEHAIESVLAELDPHSSYISAEEMKRVEESFSGSFSGVGIEYDMIRDTLTVVNAIPNAPAFNVGMMAGDKIVAVDHRDVVKIAKSEVPKLLRGEKGSVVYLDVVRRGVPSAISFRVVRDAIPINTVDAAYTVNPSTGYIKVNRFADNTMREFEQAFDRMGTIDNLILDLRGNGGGLLEQAVMMARFFLPAGSTVVSVEGRSTPPREYRTSRNGRFTNGRVVVMIDSSSASSSEIVAGALQDWDRAIIVGMPSFGKGLVQRQIPLADGSAVRITTAYYHTPTGRVIQRPFVKGKSDEYYSDFYKRFMDEHYRDSINRTAPVYATLRSGRRVLGGGGIYPDVYVPLDTTRNYTYYNDLVRTGVFNECVNGYLESSRADIQRRYPTFDQFNAEFAIDEPTFEELNRLAVERGVKSRPLPDQTDELKLHMKALVASKMWSTSEYFFVLNPARAGSYTKAVEIIENWDTYAPLLKGDSTAVR